eukprot:gnl/MRDRNA2_/MRDRNA2_71134_c0_seq1.p1 gnl/MRDRNA2_/MRDRNA2_71134_c0~~gnl/MRDRNA2_/MRDRNA2_71134_c0_seq1.p1  ORF type:complete len:359 (+),score=74.37 gnl/MRDRNA2_/MRDRNA2_71134_c0_seq1:185-1261(+)
MNSVSVSVVSMDTDQVLQLLPEALVLISVAINIVFVACMVRRYTCAAQDEARIKLERKEHLSDTLASTEPKQQKMTSHHPCVVEFLQQLSSKCMPAASRLLLDMRRIGMCPTPSFYRSLLQHMSRLGAPRALFDRLVADMEEQNCPKDSQMECYRIQYLARTDGAQVALDEFKKFLENGFQPNLRTFECLMVACLKEKMQEPLKELFDNMEDLSLIPTPVVYSSLITSYGQTGAISCSLAALEQMKEEFANDPKSLQMGYVSALHALARNHRMSKTASLFDEFIDQGLQLDARLVGILLVAAVQTESAAFAKKLIKQAKKAQVKDLVTTAERLLRPFERRPGSETVLAIVWAVLRESS